jgi:hypothetical protein
VLIFLDSLSWGFFSVFIGSPFLYSVTVIHSSLFSPNSLFPSFYKLLVIMFLKMIDLWDVALCSLIHKSNLMMEAVSTSEMLVSFARLHPSTQSCLYSSPWKPEVSPQCFWISPSTFSSWHTSLLDYLICTSITHTWVCAYTWHKLMHHFIF